MLGIFLEDWLYSYPLGRLLQLHFTDEKIKAQVPWDLYSFLTYLLILSTHVSLGLLMLPNDANVLMEWNQPSPGDYGVEMISKWLCSQKKKKRFWMVTFFFLLWLDPFLDKTKQKGIFKRNAVWLHRKDLWHSLLRGASDQNREGIILAASVFSFSHVCSVAAEFFLSIMKHLKDEKKSG